MMNKESTSLKSLDAKTSLLGRFKKGFLNTKSKLEEGLKGLFSNKNKVTDEDLEALECLLIEADLGFSLVEEIIQLLKNNRFQNESEMRDTLKELLLGKFLKTDRSLRLNGKPHAVIFIGINGAGKTTTIAKLAHHFISKDKKVVLGACDTFRAGAVKQLEVWADRLNSPIVKQDEGADPGAVAYDTCQKAKSRDFDIMFLDTAGRLHNHGGLMEELKKICRVVLKQLGSESIEIVLVLDGNGGQNNFVQAKEFKKALPVDGIIITKLDGTAKGGMVVSIEEELQIPILYMGLGEAIEDLVPFDPETFVQALLDDSK